MDRGLPDKRVPRPGRRCRARLPTRHRSRSSRPEWSSADPRPDAGMRSRSSVSARGAGVGRRRDRRPAHRSPRMVLDHRYRLAPVPGSGRPGSDGHRSSTRRLLQTVSRSARIGSWGIVHRLVHQRTGSRSSQSERFEAKASARANDGVETAALRSQRTPPCRRAAGCHAGRAATGAEPPLAL